MPTTESSHQTVISEDLVAYLDGELENDAARRVEELLQSDELVRDEVTRLQRAWDVLERLPRAEADESLAQSTVEMLAVEAEEQLRDEHTARPRRWLIAWSGAAVGCFLAGFLGVLLTNTLWPDPDRSLLEDLPVIERIQLYEPVGSIEFLQELKSRDLFTERPSAAKPQPPITPPDAQKQ